MKGLITIVALIVVWLITSNVYGQTPPTPKPAPTVAPMPTPKAPDAVKPAAPTPTEKKPEKKKHRKLFAKKTKPAS